LVTENNYRNVEQDVHVDKVENIVEIVKSDFVKIDALLIDYAHWEATLNYINGSYENYVEENLPQAIYTDFSIEYILVIDENDKPLYKMRYDHESGILEDISTEHEKLFMDFKDQSGVIQHGDDIIYSATYDITGNDDTISTDGRMIFAFYLDDVYVHDLSEKIGVDIVSTSVRNTQGFSKDSTKVIHSNDSQYNIAAIYKQNAEQSVSSVCIPIINSEEQFCLMINLPSNIYELGQKQKMETILMVLISLGVFLIIVMFSIKKAIIERVETLNSQVDKITLSKETEERVGIEGSDEISQLSNGINAMLNEIEIMHLEVKKHATIDEMTGVYNRRAGYKKLESVFMNQERLNIGVAVVLIDLDGLKKVNDNYGHLYGDQLLISLVQFLNQYLSDDDFLIRMGGDEFLFVVSKKDLKQTKDLMMQIENDLDVYNANYKEPLKLKFSFGIELLQSGMKLDVLIDNADKKMYEHKLNRKNANV